ncbi:hypothetical protein [Microbacterium sp. NPDC097977]|uniref:hypothetical protein n=1 Tax=Microbacterium sp. NPDC097977 TaxID=3155686 RepID=UPI00332FA276
MRTPTQSADLVQYLNEALGPTLVSTLAGSKETQIALAWAQEHGARPDAAALSRLEVAGSVWRTVREAEGDDVARAWFIGGNPWLRDDTAITAIREGRFEEVIAAAQALVDDSFSG